MKTSIEILLIAGVAGVAIWVVTELNISGEIQSSQSIPRANEAVQQKHVKQVDLTAVAIPTAPTCVSQTPIFTQGNIFIPLDEKLIEDKLQLAYKDPQKVIDDYSKNPASALALFRFVSTCFPKTSRSAFIAKQNNGCPAYDLKLIVKFHPIEILETQAELGSIDAKFQYGLTAPLAVAQLKQLGTAESYEYAQRILTLGKRYSEEAAKAGSADAMRYVSRAYATGEFGVRDKQNAYIYALPLSFFGTAEDAKLISELGNNLTTEQRNAAQISSLGCDISGKFEALKNPLG